MTIVEQAAYLKGLTEGMGIVGPDSDDGKLWGALTTLLSDMAREIEDLQASHLDMADAVDELGEELAYLEELTLDLDQPEDFDDLDEDDFLDEDEPPRPYRRPPLHLYQAPDMAPELPEDEDLDEEDESYAGVLYDVTCPSCGKEISFDEETLDEGSITCPGCGEILEFDLGDDEE